jgi:hypothetical protein
MASQVFDSAIPLLRNDEWWWSGYWSADRDRDIAATNWSVDTINYSRADDWGMTRCTRRVPKSLASLITADEARYVRPALLNIEDATTCWWTISCINE